MVYKITKSGEEINRIVASEDFVKAYCDENGWAFEEYPIEKPETEDEPTDEERISALEEAMLALMEVDIDV